MNDIQLFDNGEFEPWAASALPGRVARGSYGGYVYVVEFSTAIVKVGRTNNPQSRIRNHEQDARVHGQRIARLWLSSHHLNEVTNEGELIAYGRLNASSVMRNEYFSGLAFGRVVDFAESLSYQPVTDEEIAQRSEQDEARFQALKKGFLQAVGPARNSSGLDAYLGGLFGLQPDGSYRTPEGLKREDPETLEPLLRRLAAASGRPVEELLTLSWLDIHTETIQMAVSAASLRLRAYAQENGIGDLLQPIGDACDFSFQDSTPLPGETA